MKSIGLFLLVSVAVFGQRGLNNTGVGNVVYPGTGRPPAVIHPLPSTTFGGAARHGTIVPPSSGRRLHGGGSVVYVPYGVGVPMYAEPSGPPVQMYYPQQQAAP